MIKGKAMLMVNALALGGIGYFALRRAKKVRHKFQGRHLPNFAYANGRTHLSEQQVQAEIGIPVFTYHSIATPPTPDAVTPSEFEAQMRYLVDNGYHTLTADAFYEHLVSGTPVPPKSVVLTFDDGRATLWTVAYPILKKYGLHAISFIVPGVMTERAPTFERRPTLETYWQGNITTCDEPFQVDLSDTPAITWAEAHVMQQSGVIDFQSHTLDHTLIYYAPEIVDFVHPNYRLGYHNFGMPITDDKVHKGGRSTVEIGTPVYRFQSRMGAGRRFIDDPDLREACVAHVYNHGGNAFFERETWRAELLEIAAHYRQTHECKERFETEEEQTAAIRHSLEESKRLIEHHLPGQRVRHLCYPWHLYSAKTTRLAQEAGYVTNFIDINPQKRSQMWNDPYATQSALPINEFGDDPYQITRIDASDNMVLSLPGVAPLSYRQRLLTNLLAPPAKIQTKLSPFTSIYQAAP